MTPEASPIIDRSRELNTPTSRLLRKGVDEWLKSHEGIQEANPLGADRFFQRDFPQLNRFGNRRGLRTAAEHMVWIAQPLIQAGGRREADVTTARAAKRDIGFVVAAYRYHHGDIPDIVGLEKTLGELSARTGDQPVLTTDDLTLYNPGAAHADGDPRMRLLTGDPLERFFTEQTSAGRRELPYALLDLYEASQFKDGIFNEQYAPLLQNAARNIRPMVRSMANIVNKKSMKPTDNAITSVDLFDFFTFDIQPYFRKKITIDGTTYSQTGGGQIEIFEVDRLTWGQPLATLSGKEASEKGSPKGYAEFHADNRSYLAPPLQAISQAIDTDCPTSLLDSMVHASGTLETRTDTEIDHARNSFLAMRDLMDNILDFRKVHTAVAIKSLRKRREKEGITEGSGGQDEKFLSELKQWTEQQRIKLNIVAQNLGMHDLRPYPISPYTSRR